MPLTNVQKQRRFTVKSKERRDYLKDLVANDVEIIVEETTWGTIRITYDMAVETNAALEAWCKERGYTLDDMLQDLNKECMTKAARDAKRQRRAK